ncbi:MAG: DUF4252 domain-containing protein [Candidatus Cryptobacteroides sp.]|nr:DUF4252 domain-containing protein [Candidatus Cryptobacteroides sp.]
MKKIYAIIAAAMLITVPALSASAQTDAASGASMEQRDGKNAANVKPAETLSLKQVIKKYKKVKKVDYLKVDGFLLTVAKAGMKADDEMPAEAVDALKCIHILSLDDSSSELRHSFRTDMAAALSGSEMILEAQDEEDKVGIYVGKMDGQYFEDFIVYESDDCDLIVMQGKFPLSALQRMVNEHID